MTTKRYSAALRKMANIAYRRWDAAHDDRTNWGITDANDTMHVSGLPLAPLVGQGIEPKSFKSTAVYLLLSTVTMGTKQKGFADTDPVYTTTGDFVLNLYYPLTQTERVDSYQLARALAEYLRDGFIEGASIADADDFGIMFFEPSVMEKMLYADREEIGRKFYRFNAQVRYMFDECPTAHYA